MLRSQLRSTILSRGVETLILFPFVHCLSKSRLLWIVPPLLMASAAAQSPVAVGELFASETTAHGPVLLTGAGMEVDSGSQLTAGKSVATLRLTRGGEVRICPDSSLSVSAVDTGPAPPGTDRELMLAMDTGSLELDYPLNDLADTLITPDFKLMLAGPGVFHFALGVTNRGDTCVKPLRGNSASIIVTEMTGSAVYQIKPDEAVMFGNGKLNERTPLIGSCGCPRPLPVMEAEKTPEPTKAAPEKNSVDSALNIVPPQPDAGSPPPQGVHVEVEAPLVFHGDQASQQPYVIAKVKFSALPNVFSPQENLKPVVLKPGKGEVSQEGKKKKGFFGRIKGFFASLFHH